MPKKRPQRRTETIKPDMSDYPWPGKSDPEAFKAWRREYDRRFRALNHELCKAVREAYENSAEGKAVREAYNNSARCKAVMKAYQNSPEYKAVREAYLNSAKGKAVGKRKNARRRHAKSIIPLTKEERQQLVILEEKRLHLSETTGILHHLDHIVPLAKGGIHHPINLRIITAEENLSKGDRMTPEAMALIPQIQAIVHEREGWINTEQDGTLADLFTTEEK